MGFHMARTWPLLVDEDACEAWLDRALLSSDPVKLDTRVVDPTVVSKVTEPLVSVETMGETTVVAGTEVAPATPLMPEMVVSPVSVVVTEPLVKTEVQVSVVMAEAAPLSLEPEPEPEPAVELESEPEPEPAVELESEPEPEPEPTVEVVTKVDEPLIMVVTTTDGLAEVAAPCIGALARHVANW
jgi:hypothetical protein